MSEPVEANISIRQAETPRKIQLPDRYNHDLTTFDSPLQTSVLADIRTRKTTKDHMSTFTDFANILNAETIDVRDEEALFMKTDAADSEFLRTVGSLRNAKEEADANTEQKEFRVGDKMISKEEIEQQYLMQSPFERKAKELEELGQYVIDIQYQTQETLPSEERLERINKLKKYITQQKQRWDQPESETATDYWVIFDQFETYLTVREKLEFVPN